jgi:hypothetical protein
LRLPRTNQLSNYQCHIGARASQGATNPIKFAL